MRIRGLILCCSVTLSGAAMASDDWLGLESEQPVLVGFDLGQDEAEDATRALLLAVPFGDAAGYYGYYSETDISDGEQDFESLVLATTVWIQLSQLIDIELQHFFEGNEDELEKETLGIALGLSQGNWSFRIQLEDGDLLLFTRDDVADLASDALPSRFDSDVSSYALSLGWQVDPWYWEARYQRYDYEEDLPPLNRSLVAQLVIKSAALAQTSLLIEESSSVTIGHGDFKNDYSIAFAEDKSAIDETYEQTLILNWLHWSSLSMGYSFTAAMPIPGDSIGLTVGLRWVL